MIKQAESSASNWGSEAGWVDCTITKSLSAGDYWLTTTSNGYRYLYYDTGASGQGVHNYVSGVYPTSNDPLNDPSTNYGTDTKKFSIYATYTTGEPTPTPTPTATPSPSPSPSPSPTPNSSSTPIPTVTTGSINFNSLMVILFFIINIGLCIKRVPIIGIVVGFLTIILTGAVFLQDTSIINAYISYVLMVVAFSSVIVNGFDVKGNKRIRK